jgi:hypothetical protein
VRLSQPMFGKPRRLPHPCTLNIVQGPGAGRIHPIPRIYRPLFFRLYRSTYHLSRRPRNGDQDLDGILRFGRLHEKRGRRRGRLVMDRSGLWRVASGTSWVYQEGRVRRGDPGLVGESLSRRVASPFSTCISSGGRESGDSQSIVFELSTDPHVSWMGGAGSSVRCEFHRLSGTFPGTRIRVKLLHRSVSRSEGLHSRGS